LRISNHTFPCKKKRRYRIKGIVQNKGFVVERHGDVCFFEEYRNDRRGTIKVFYDQNILKHHLSQCPYRFEWSYEKRCEIFQLIKTGIQNGFSVEIVSRLSELRLKKQK